MTTRDKIGVAARAAADELRAFQRAESGAVAIILALALLPIFLMLGVTVDYSRATNARTRMQDAADAGAVAAANLSAGTQAQRQSAAQTMALASLGPLASQINATVAESEQTPGQYKVTVTGGLNTAVMQLAHVETIALGTSAVAMNTVGGGTTTTTTTTTTPVNVCLLVLAKSTSQAFLANSGAKINAPNCEVDVASMANTAAMLDSGASFNVNNFCVASTSVTNNGATITPALKTGCTAASDTIAGTLPTVTVGSCTVSNQNYSGNVTLSPGVYCGNFNFNGSGSLTLNPGLYIFKGVSWNLNSSWSMTGSGVTLYFADTSYLQFNGAANVTLTAPTTGTYANILMYEAPNLSTSSFTINGGAATPDGLAGLIYLPSRNVTFNSGASVNSAAITMVVNTLIMDGVTWNWTASPFGIASASSSTTTTSTTTTTAPSSARLTQ